MQISLQQTAAVFNPARIICQGAPVFAELMAAKALCINLTQMLLHPASTALSRSRHTLAMNVSIIISPQPDLCSQLFGSAPHGSLPSEVGAGAWGRCYHNSPDSALPHLFPRQNHHAHSEPVSPDSAYASRNTPSGWCTCSCMSWVCRWWFALQHL